MYTAIILCDPKLDKRPHFVLMAPNILISSEQSCDLINLTRSVKLKLPSLPLFMQVHHKPLLAVMLAFVYLTLAMTWDAWTNSAGYGSFETPNPLAYSQHSLFFWSAIRRFFFLWLYGWALPSPFKILWFPCMLLLGPAGRWLMAWHSPEQSEGFLRAYRPTLSHISVSETWGKIGIEWMNFYTGNRHSC